ncbi:erythromycin esterase family protein [Ktedonosporobacter rubrisoli]|uniref:Erythromycin esterase family protein n=1 Tax=Ktedonosporobacter rubrisoli TaxID=2509675 RepID=A0A4V0YYM7_KTERU|nr:erythromycin esterase family protein [Ktedonosporobacter rubrisoli]QBD76761.1 erythromycin esterase family protein [Ktedonosporobacter rubrisoli]
MTHTAPTYATLDEWIEREALQFSLSSPTAFNAAVDKMLASLGNSVELLGLGEALHGGEDILTLRNRLFERLVTAHGYSAIAVESSFPKGWLTNEYVAGRGPQSYAEVEESGFSHGFGRLEANRELIEWMRSYNAKPSHQVKLKFYGFDSPTEMYGSDSPRQVLHFVLDYLTPLDSDSGLEHRSRIEPLLGQDAAWENPATLIDPTKSIGLSEVATALRMETEELISTLQIQRPELVARSDEERYLEAVHYAMMARQLLNYHANLAQTSDKRFIRLLGMRDALMADNLVYIVSRERRRGKVLAFAHNSHLQRGKAQLSLPTQLGPDVHIWWPAGAHLEQMLGPRYVIIGTGLGSSEPNGIARPEANTLEARLTAVPGPGRFIPTHKGQGLPASDIAALPARTASKKNPSYFPLSPESLVNFDWLAVLDSTAYTRGAPVLPDQK